MQQHVTQSIVTTLLLKTKQPSLDVDNLLSGLLVCCYTVRQDRLDVSILREIMHEALPFPTRLRGAETDVAATAPGKPVQESPDRDVMDVSCDPDRDGRVT